MALTKIGSIGINTGIAFAGVTTIATLNASDNVLSVGGTVNFVSDVSIGGTVSIAGTLTYEDVTNVDAVGLITARDGINVGSGITLSVDGDIFATGVVTATSFSGSGALLTGVASTENIRTNTNATFLQNINVSGTVTATSYAGSGVDLTNLPAANLTGTLAAISGANLTNLDASDLASGTVPDARFPATLPAVSGANLTGIEAGITTEAASISGITTYLNLSKDDHELIVTGTNTISVIGGAQGGSHTLRLQNSGIATVTLDSTYFKFASGATPSLPTADGAISLVSFTIHKAGAVGVNTVLLTGASVSFS